jgi:transcriptional regulator with XRE-family HTH domain
MKFPVKSAADLGLLARATRRSSRLRLDDVAGSAKLGPVFVGDVERGKETVQLGRVLRLLDELGIELLADVPQAALDEIEKLKAKGVKPHKPRAKKKTTEPAK